MEIDETVAEAHTSLAVYRMYYEWDWLGAEREYNRAIELNPNLATAHLEYAGYLEGTARLDQAIDELKRAAELAPLTPFTVTAVGYPFYYARQHDEAVKYFRRGLELDPNFFWGYLWIGQAYVEKKMYEEAIAEIEKAIALSAGNTRAIATLGYAYGVSGKKGEAQKVLDELKQRSDRSYVSPYFIALVYTGLKKKDEAFEWLEKAYNERHPYLAFLKVEPVFDTLRPDPRFADLLRRIGLSQ
jgi:adenylate cyclase